MRIQPDERNRNLAGARRGQKFTVIEATEANAVGAANWKQKNADHFVLQLQFFYF